MKKIVFAVIPFTYLLFLLFQIDLAMLGDLGRHLKLGEVIVQCFCVPQTNLFSYTFPNFPIVNHEWLTEVFFYLTSLWFGLQGLLALKMVIIITTASLLYSVAIKKGSMFWVTIFSLLCLTIFSTRFHVLPELFSYLFMGLFIFLIERYKNTKHMYLLWLLPVLELLWVNMHIYFVIGIGMYGLFFIEHYIKQNKFDKRLALIGIVLLFSTILNPGFIRGALLPFIVFGNYGLNVEENANPFSIFTPTSTNTNLAYTLVLQVVIFEVLIVLFAITLFFRKQWKDIFLTGSSLFAAGLGLKFLRCISVFGVLGFIPLVQGFTFLEKDMRKHIDISMTNILKGTCALIVVCIVLFHIKGLSDYKILNFSFVPSAENAIAFIKQSGMKGPIFNNYRIGNYLIYGLYPQEKVYIDARPEAYPAAFFDEYWRMMADEQFFNDQVKKYSINAVVFNVDDDPVKIRPFLIRLISSKEWTPVYGDGLVTIFVRNNDRNKTVIEKYRIKTSDIPAQ
jgi:hypothetical protein